VRILITGVSGQVGSALMRRLRSLGSLLPTDRSALDLSKPVGIAARLDALKPDVIINPAAYTAVDKAEDERDTAFAVNAEAPAAIAQWAAKRGAPLVHFSTDYVFAGDGETPWREEDSAAPLNIYGASKLAGENAIRAAGGPHLIVRTEWVYAATGANFLRTIARLARERHELRIVADQVGSPTSAAGLADMLAEMVQANSPDLAGAFAKAGGIVHMTAAGYASWHDFATAIVAGLKARGVALKVERIVPVTTADYPTRAPRPRNSRFDLTRLRDVLDIAPPRWKTLLEAELDALAPTLR
jgi:dTDP-4-dehydrorhamnose reductase